MIFSKVVNPNYLLWAYPFLVYILVKRQSRVGLRLLVLATMIASIWPGLYLFVPAVLDRPAYIEEVMNYYNARTLLERSFQGYGEELILKILDISGYKFGPIFEFLYMNMNIIGVALILSYTSVLLYILIAEVGGFKNLSMVIHAIESVTRRLIRSFKVSL